MSNRLDTSDIINKGDYLSLTFNPASLTVAHLTGILQYHEIRLPPAPITKAKLVDAFNREIRTKALDFQRERMKKNSMEASDDGIFDGVSGLPLSNNSSKKNSESLPRRSSRRLSRDVSENEDLIQPEPPKRRRSSAQPELGGPSRKRAVAKQPALIEESESEEDQAARKVVRRSKDSEAAGSSARRVSQNFGPGTEDSGWEDYNVFQSGPESSSPIRAPPRKSRKSSTRMSSRKSLSEPPQPSSVANAKSPAPPQSKVFAPVLPHNSGQWPGLPPIKREPDAPEDTSAMADVSGEIIEEPESEDEDEHTQTTVSAMIPSTKSDTLSHPSGISGKRPRFPVFRRTVLVGFILAFLGSIFQYGRESAPIGYCDRGSQTNGKLAELRKEQLEIEACQEQRAIREEIVCPTSSNLFHPDACTPCPGHANCYLEDVICDDGYLLKQHPLSFLSKICNGLPGLGPVAFPSKCIEDPMRRKSIGALGKGIDSILAIERGRRICTDESKDKSFGGEAEKWGLEVERLKDDMKRKAPPPMAENFDILFGEAVQQLLDYGHVIKGKDSEGRLFLATEHVDMSWNCQITVAVRNTWKEWRKFVFGILALLLSGVYGRAQIAAKRNEDRRVSELVQLALDTLRNQELSHHTDPITTPAPYLSSLQLRDSTLQDEHSIAARTRLWARVEKVVEGNANVRANMEELPGGDELRVWRWVGTGGRPRQIPLRDADIGQRKFFA